MSFVLICSFSIEVQPCVPAEADPGGSVGFPTGRRGEGRPVHHLQAVRTHFAIRHSEVVWATRKADHGAFVNDRD